MKKLFTVLTLGFVSMSIVGAELTPDEQLKLARQLSLEAREAQQLAQVLAETDPVTAAELQAIAEQESLAQVKENAQKRVAQEAAEVAAAIQAVEKFEEEAQREVPLSAEEVQELASMRARLTLLEEITPFQNLVQKRLAEPRTRVWPEWLTLWQQSYLPENAHREIDKWIRKQQDRNILKRTRNQIKRRKKLHWLQLKGLDKESDEYKQLEPTLKAWDEVAEKIKEAIKKLPQPA